MSAATIEIAPYSPEWPTLFTQEARLLQQALAPWLVADIEHFGSTAVPGLAAKPVIDIAAPVRDLQTSAAAIDVAQSLGYCHYPYKPDQMHWFCKPSPERRTHHLHIIPWRSPVWRDRLAFRDALRQDADLARAYCELKLMLARQHPNDREAYTDGKTLFVAAVLGQCR